MADKTMTVDAPAVPESGEGVGDSGEGNLDTGQLTGMLLQGMAGVSEEGEGEPNEQVTDGEPETETDSDADHAESEEQPSESEEDTEEPDEESEESEEPDEEDDSYLDSLKESAAKKARKRIDKLTARAKEAEEQLKAREEALQTLEQRLSKLEKGEQPQQEGQRFTDKVKAASSPEELQELYSTAREAKKWARGALVSDRFQYDADSGEDVIIANGAKLTKQQVSQILSEAEDAIEQVIPSRAQYIQARQTADKNAESDFPAWRDRSNPDYERLQGIYNDDQFGEFFQAAPNGRYLAGVMLEGIKALEAKKVSKDAPPAKPKAQQKIAPKVPSGDEGMVSTPKRDNDDLERRFKNAETLSQDDFVAYLAAKEAARSKSKG